MKTYRVVIPYYYEFLVKATSKKNAILKAHNAGGTILGWDDERTEVEEMKNYEEN